MVSSLSSDIAELAKALAEITYSVEIKKRTAARQVLQYFSRRHRKSLAIIEGGLP
jgi:hypothetical protein